MNPAAVILERLLIAGHQVSATPDRRLQITDADRLAPALRAAVVNHRDEILATVANPATALPGALRRWPPMARYLAAELQAAGAVDRDKAEAVVRRAWARAATPPATRPGGRP